MNERGEWVKSMSWNLKALAILLIALAVMGALSSCSHKVVEKVQTDTLLISKTDTFLKEKVVEKSVKEYVDRWNDRFVVVTTAGDTVRDIQKQVVYVEKDTHLRDSIDRYKSIADSLRSARNNQQYIEVQKPPNLKDCMTLLGFVAGIGIMLYIRRKA